MNTNYTTEGGNTLGEKCWEFTGQQRWVVCPVAFLGFSLASSSTVNAAGSPQVWGAQETGRQKKDGVGALNNIYFKKRKSSGGLGPRREAFTSGATGGPMGPRRRFRPESETREGRCGRRSAGHAGRGEPTGRAALGLERCRKPGEPAGAAVLRLPPGRPAGSRRPLRPGRTWEPPNQEYFKCDSWLSTAILISQEFNHMAPSLRAAHSGVWHQSKKIDLVTAAAQATPSYCSKGSSHNS
nr:uncharacterized protein LOC118970583 [Manis javanica]